MINVLIVSDESIDCFYPSIGNTKVYRKIPIFHAAPGKPRDYILLPVSDSVWSARWEYHVRQGVSVTQVVIEGLSAVDGLNDKAKFCIEKSLGGVNTVDSAVVIVGSNDEW